MKKQAKDLKKGETISIAGQKYEIVSIETSDIGKQGKRKCRIEAASAGGEKLVLVRPEDYPFETQ